MAGAPLPLHILVLSIFLQNPYLSFTSSFRNLQVREHIERVESIPIYTYVLSIFPVRSRFTTSLSHPLQEYFQAGRSFLSP